MLTIWHKPYTVKRYTTDGTVELTVRMNVQPAKNQDHQNEPHGESTFLRLVSFGRVKIHSADEHTGQAADRLLYHGRWYDCTSCILWEHTGLRHYEADWVEIPPYGLEQERGHYDTI
ncbi:MAG: hypothetical protein FWG65_09755 [Turicibacter sp.]|nr:hypothetical protein [Turicibacter sp.]